MKSHRDTIYLEDAEILDHQAFYPLGDHLRQKPVGIMVFTSDGHEKRPGVNGARIYSNPLEALSAATVQKTPASGR